MSTESRWALLHRELVPERAAVTGGTRLAQAAVERILGPDLIREAVDEYFACREGAELARSVLRLIRSQLARKECLQVLQGAGEASTRQAAAELLRSLLTPETIENVRPLLEDDDEVVCVWMAKAVDDLAGELEAGRLREWVEYLEESPIHGVREVGTDIRQHYLESTGQAE